MEENLVSIIGKYQGYMVKLMEDILSNSRSNQFKTIDSKYLERLYIRLVVCHRRDAEILQNPPDHPFQLVN